MVVQATAVAIERVAPRRPFAHGIGTRWLGNFGLLGANLLVVGALFPVGASLGVALWCEREGVGLLHAVPIGNAAGLALAIVALDLCMWLQHWAQHKIPLLWRSHRVHHTDLDLDFTTSLRFHPFEAVYTMAARSSFVALLGLPFVGVALYELLLNLGSSLTHASLPLPERADAWLRKLFVTPDFHRVHHSARHPEMERNFSSVFSVWDRAFGTYRAQPEKGHLDMELGLEAHREPRSLHALRLLALPFR